MQYGVQQKFTSECCENMPHWFWSISFWWMSDVRTADQQAVLNITKVVTLTQPKQFIFAQTLFDAVIHAKSRFFDVTPTGSVINRFSGDLHMIDAPIPGTLSGIPLLWQ